MSGLQGRRLRGRPGNPPSTEVLAGLAPAGLGRAGYSGLATIEQDRRAGSPGDPAADLRRSVERLRAAGIGAP